MEHSPMMAAPKNVLLTHLMVIIETVMLPRLCTGNLIKMVISKSGVLLKTRQPDTLMQS